MKIVSIILALAFGLAGLFATIESAKATANQRIRRTERHQKARIREGVRSGELSKDEAKDLRQDQKEIRQKRKAAKRDDGVIDGQERKELRQDQKDASQKIHEEKHDSEKSAD